MSVCFSFWCSVLFQSAEPGSAFRTEQLTFTRRGNDPGCLQLDWCLCWSLYHHFLPPPHSQFCSPGEHRKASPTLKLVLTLTPALIDFQGPAPAGLCNLGRATDRLARRWAGLSPGGEGGWMDGWMNEPPSDLLSARTASSGRTGVNSASRPHTGGKRERIFLKCPSRHMLRMEGVKI